jgi:hypothetical protein
VEGIGDRCVGPGPPGRCQDPSEQAAADALAVQGIGDLDSHFHDPRVVRVEDPPGDPDRFPVVLGDERLVLARHERREMALHRGRQSRHCAVVAQIGRPA